MKLKKMKLGRMPKKGADPVNELTKILSEELAKAIDKDIWEGIILEIRTANINLLKRSFPNWDLEMCKEMLELSEEELNFGNMESIIRNYRMKNLLG